MPTGLAKQILEIPLVAGLSQHVAPEVAPPGMLYDLTNVEIDRIGNVARRHGYELMNDAAFNLGSSSVSSQMGIPKKIGGRVDELWVLTSEAYYLGSGGGGGAAGDMLWTYSPELDAWKPHTKVPRPTMERWSGLASSGIDPEHASIGFITKAPDFFNPAGTNLIVVAYVVKLDGGNANAGVHVTVFDATSRAVIVEDTLLDAVSAVQVRVVSIGSKAIVLWSSVFLDAVQASIFDAADPEAGFSAPVELFGGSTIAWNADTDGTQLFFFLTADTLDVELLRYTSSLVFDGGNTISSGGNADNLALAVAGGRVHLVWTTQGVSPLVRYASVATNGGLGTSILNVSEAVSIPFESVTIAALDADRATVFYLNGVQASTGVVIGSARPILKWRQISAGSTTPTRGDTEHSVINIVPQNEAFVFDGRVFLPVTGADVENQFRADSGDAPDVYSGYGHSLVEVAADAGTGVQYMTPMPVSVWSRDASRINADFRIANGCPGNDSDRYLCSLRLLRNVDRFGGGGQDPGGGSVSEPSVDTTAAYGIDIVRLAFDDKKRWAHSEINKCAVISSGLPYAYDGLLAHECGFVFRAEILGIFEFDSGGNWNIDDEPTYKVTYEWEDMHGNRWFSDSSYPAQYRVTAGQVTLQICVRLLTLSTKPLGGNHDYGRVKIQLFRATSSAKEDFQKLEERFVDLYDSQNIFFTDDNNGDYLEAERIYTIGGELDNALCPPCRAIVQHGPRLSCISTDDGKLWLTKETRFQRGIEWSAFLTMTLPQRGMALASTETALIVLCEKSIYVLEGAGPNALGQPPDGWRLTLLAHDKGCSEYNAAWRTPVGVVYRGYQGLWLIDGSLSTSFVGDPVTDFTDLVDRFVDGSLDTKSGRLRLLCLMTNGDYRILNFWYDSNRWSIDTIEETEGTQYSSTVFKGVYYRALEEGVYQASADVFDDGKAFPLYLASVRTGWLRMGAMHDFKRVWRALGTVGKIRAEMADPTLDLRFTVENESGICASRLFTSSLFPPLGDWSIRMHLEKQKGKAFRMELTEVANDASDEREEDNHYVNPSRGYTFSVLGLEYGVKRGAAKLPGARSK